MSDKTKETDDLGADQAQAAMDEETDKGYRGDNPDPTPLKAYTVEGVNRGMPTPETHESAREAVRKHQARNNLG